MFNKKLVMEAVKNMSRDEFMAKFREALDESDIPYDDGYGQIIWSRLAPPGVEDDSECRFCYYIILPSENKAVTERSYVPSNCHNSTNRYWENYMPMDYENDKLSVAVAV